MEFQDNRGVQSNLASPRFSVERNSKEPIIITHGSGALNSPQWRGLVRNSESVFQKLELLTKLTTLQDQLRLTTCKQGRGFYCSRHGHRTLQNIYQENPLRRPQFSKTRAKNLNLNAPTYHATLMLPLIMQP